MRAALYPSELMSLGAAAGIRTQPLALIWSEAGYKSAGAPYTSAARCGTPGEIRTPVVSSRNGAHRSALPQALGPFGMSRTSVDRLSADCSAVELQMENLVPRDGVEPP